MDRAVRLQPHTRAHDMRRPHRMSPLHPRTSTSSSTRTHTGSSELPSERTRTGASVGKDMLWKGSSYSTVCVSMSLLRALRLARPAPFARVVGPNVSRDAAVRPLAKRCGRTAALELALLHRRFVDGDVGARRELEQARGQPVRVHVLARRELVRSPAKGTV